MAKHIKYALQATLLILSFATVSFAAAQTQTVQHNSGFTGSASSIAVKFRSSVTAGDVLLVAQSTFDGETLNAPADSQGNAFALLVTGNSPGAAVAAIYIATPKLPGLIP